MPAKNVKPVTSYFPDDLYEFFERLSEGGSLSASVVKACVQYKWELEKTVEALSERSQSRVKEQIVSTPIVFETVQQSLRQATELLATLRNSQNPK